MLEQIKADPSVMYSACAVLGLPGCQPRTLVGPRLIVSLVSSKGVSRNLVSHGSNYLEMVESMTTVKIWHL